MLTPFTELDRVLADLVGSVRDILGDGFVGAYLQGSFALGAGDTDSDCDFIIATTTLPSGRVEADLRRLHDHIPTRAGFWTRHLEGSYADVASLRSVAGLGVRWLYCDHGHRELIWDTHCNGAHVRWILRYAVSTYCRILYTLHTARVADKQAALRWAWDNLDPRWRPLLTQVMQDRALGWDPTDPPRPGSLAATYEFAKYAEAFAA